MISQKEDLLFFHGFWTDISFRLRAYIKKTIKNPRWLLMSVAGRFQLIRYAVVFFAKPANTQQYQVLSKSSNLKISNVEHIVKTLKKDGVYSGISLSENLRQEILEFAYSTYCYGDLEPHCGFLYSEKERIEKEIGRNFFTAQYFNTSLLCPAIGRLGSDPKLLEIAASYIGAEPVYTGSRLWWNFVTDDAKPYDSSKTITFFHYDLDDYACLRFFFYLTDVECDDGAHVCVRSSHINKKPAYLFLPVKRRSEQDIIDYYGSENIMSIYGSAGFGFAEDTFCYHKATRPLRKNRLMLQIQFALHDYSVHNDIKDPFLLRRIA
jgi:hypothetical protein